MSTVEGDQNLDGSIPNMPVHSLPVLKNDQIIDVLVATSAEKEGDELPGPSGMQFHLVQKEQLDEPSSSDDDDRMAVVNQGWFTRKEDKESLARQGHEWKSGRWSKEETDILRKNIESYMKKQGTNGDPREIIFEKTRGSRVDFYRAAACGLKRPLFAIYRKVIRMYDNKNHMGKYSPEEVETIRKLQQKHGNKWVTIGAALGRNASSVRDRSRTMTDTSTRRKWTKNEEERLAQFVYEFTNTDPGENVTQGVPWPAVAKQVGTRSEKQCRSKWLNHLNWKQRGGTEWTKEDEATLIHKLAELDVVHENDIDWHLLAQGWSSVRSPQWLRSKWWHLKRKIENYKCVSFPVLIKEVQLLQDKKNKELLESESKSGDPNSNPTASVEHAVIRDTVLEDH